MSRLCCSITQDRQRRGPQRQTAPCVSFCSYRTPTVVPSLAAFAVTKDSIVPCYVLCCFQNNSWQVGQVCSSFSQLSSVANGGSRAVLLLLLLRTSSWAVRACRGFPLVDSTPKGTGACAVAVAGDRCGTVDWGCSAEVEASRGFRAGI